MSVCRCTIQAQTGKIIFFVVCINVNLQVIQCFSLHLFSLTNFSEGKIKTLGQNIALGQNSILRRNRKWLTARALFVFMVIFSYYDWSFFLWSLHIGYDKRQHITDFSPFFFFCCYSQVATLFMFVWVFLLRYCSAGVTKLSPILKYCQTEPYRNTLPNKTLSQYITK